MASGERYTEADYEIMRAFGTRVAIACEAAGLAGPQAGAYFGVSAARWNKYLRGERFPPPRILVGLPSLLHRPLSWFFDLPDERGLSEKEGRIISLLRAIQRPDVGEAAADSAISGLEAQVALDRTLREE